MKSNISATEEKSFVRAAITSAVFLLLIFGFFVANLIYTPPDVSKSERRKLAVFTSPTLETVMNKSFMQNFDEKFSLDSFVLRDDFRRVKSLFQFYVMRQLDNNGIYIAENHAGKLETLSLGSVKLAAGKINKLRDGMLAGKSLNVYFAIIPDKGYFLAEKNGYPSIDYDSLVSVMLENLKAGEENFEYIDLFSVLTVNDYYLTDLHWDQRKLGSVVAELAEKMSFPNVNLSDGKMTELSPFYGVYCGQSALPLRSETLGYIENAAIAGAKVSYIDVKTLEWYEGEIYKTSAFNGVDPYDVFLSGAQPLVVIENPSAQTDRELYLFRDSYSSSLAPLLTSAYAKITLIDLRYIASPLLETLVEFKENSDVLFLYGNLILSNSGTLLVN